MKNPDLQGRSSYREPDSDSILCILANTPFLEGFSATYYTCRFAELSSLHRHCATTLSFLAVNVYSNDRGIFQIMKHLLSLKILAIDIVNVGDWTHLTQHCLCIPTVVDLTWKCPDCDFMDSGMIEFLGSCRFDKYGQMTLLMEDISVEEASYLIPFLQYHSHLSKLTLEFSSDVYAVLAPHIVSTPYLCLIGDSAPPMELLHHVKFPKTLDLQLSNHLTRIHEHLTQFLGEMIAVKLASIGTRYLKINLRERPFSWLDEGEADVMRLSMMAALLPIALKLCRSDIRILDKDDKDVAWLAREMVASCLLEIRGEVRERKVGVLTRCF
jgi:hypothetical protein